MMRRAQWFLMSLPMVTDIDSDSVDKRLKGRKTGMLRIESQGNESRL